MNYFFLKSPFVFSTNYFCVFTLFLVTLWPSVHYGCETCMNCQWTHNRRSNEVKDVTTARTLGYQSNCKEKANLELIVFDFSTTNPGHGSDYAHFQSDMSSTRFYCTTQIQYSLGGIFLQNVHLLYLWENHTFSVDNNLLIAFIEIRTYQLQRPNFMILYVKHMRKINAKFYSWEFLSTTPAILV